MAVFRLTEWWDSLANIEQVFWSLALVSSLLLMILFVLSWFGVEIEESEKSNEKKKPGLESKNVLLFFTYFSWAGVLLTILNVHLVSALIYATTFALFAIFVPTLIRKFTHTDRRPTLVKKTDVLSYTGRVLKTIPPHQNGYGKVTLVNQNGPFELDAVTTGGPLDIGVPVRVVDVKENRVLIVEPIEKGYPGQVE